VREIGDGADCLSDLGISVCFGPPWSERFADLHQLLHHRSFSRSGVGGAYVAVAEDVDGDLQNPASPANRPYFSVSYFDWWLGFGFTFPGTLKSMDFFNSGSETQIQNSPDSLVFITPSMNLQWGEWGMGITAEISNYSMDQNSADSQASLDTFFTVNHLQVARSWFRGQFVTGAGLRLLAMNLTEGETAQNLFSSTGSGLEVGLLLRPTGMPFRLGAAARSRIRTNASYSKDLLPNSEGDIVVDDSAGNDIYVPDQVSLPWDINVGAAVQIGKRPLNLGWREENRKELRADLSFEERRLDLEEERDLRLAETDNNAEQSAIEREFDIQLRAAKHVRDKARDAAYWEMQQDLADMSRPYLLVSASLVITGQSPDAVGIESFLSQSTRRSGEQIVYSPRLGLESEVWPDILKLRAGTYLEPARLYEADSRVHGTAGLDLRLIRWSVFGIGPDDYLWRLALSADVAERYFTWGIMVGGWYPRHSGGIASKFLE
jgi:hypothetical protein